MKHYFAFIVICFFSSNILFSSPILLHGFDEISIALVSGQKVRVILDYSKCELRTDSISEQGPKVIGGMEIQNFEFFSKGSVKNILAYISCSQSVFIYHPGYGYVLNYIKLKIFEDNSVTILAQYLNPLSYEVKMNENFYSNITVTESDMKGASFYRVD